MVNFVKVHYELMKGKVPFTLHMDKIILCFIEDY